MAEAAQSWEVNPGQFRRIRELAHGAFGLDLKPGKEALVSARLGKRARELGLGGIGAYLAYLEADRTGAELAALTDALTTNFTSFLREPQHFELLRRRVLEPAAAGRGRLAIWSAGCATGEEAYTILLCAAETLGSTLFPYTTLFRSARTAAAGGERYLDAGARDGARGHLSGSPRGAAAGKLAEKVFSEGRGAA